MLINTIGIKPSPSGINDLDLRLEALKIAAVHGQQAILAMGKHGRSDVGIVHCRPASRTARQSSMSFAVTAGPSSSTSKLLEKRATSARASVIDNASLRPAGRVTTARYSRSTCRLIANLGSNATAAAKAAFAHL
jgi:hypothetical protein